LVTDKYCLDIIYLICIKMKLFSRFSLNAIFKSFRNFLNSMLFNCDPLC